MKAFSGKYPRIVALCVTFCVLSVSQLAAQDAGSRAVFTRSGWVGARYIAMGKAAEAIADDVYAIYWNPAGLVDLRDRQTLSPDEIREKARKGDIKGISEQDLIRFSDEGNTRPFVQAGVSASMLDVEREGVRGNRLRARERGDGLRPQPHPVAGIEGRAEVRTIHGYLNTSPRPASFRTASPRGSPRWRVAEGDAGAHRRIHVQRGGGRFRGELDVLPFLRLAFVIQDIGQTMQGDDTVTKCGGATISGIPRSRYRPRFQPQPRFHAGGERR